MLNNVIGCCRHARLFSKAGFFFILSSIVFGRRPSFRRPLHLYGRVSPPWARGPCPYEITPNFFPTFLNASKPLSKSSCECAAEIITRMRALPCGTVG